MESFRVVVGAEKTRKGHVPRIAIAGRFLARAGFESGGRAQIVASPGRIIVVPHHRLSNHLAQASIGEMAESLEMLRDELMVIYAALPEGPAEMLEGRTPMTLQPELRGVLECVLADNIEPALASLNRAAVVTDAELRTEFYDGKGRRSAPASPPV